MNSNASYFLSAADRFTETVGTVSDWSAPSPCEKWTAADLVDHVVDTEREFLAGHGADLGDRPTRFSEADMDEMDQAFKGFGDAAYAPGVFQRPVAVPEDAPRQTRLLARMGRRG